MLPTFPFCPDKNRLAFFSHHPKRPIPSLHPPFLSLSLSLSCFPFILHRLLLSFFPQSLSSLRIKTLFQSLSSFPFRSICPNPNPNPFPIMDHQYFSMSPGIHPEPIPEDHFDRLPDSLLLLIFNKIADVKALGRCCVVSRRFHSLVPQVDTVLVRVDCVISDDDSSSPIVSCDRSRNLISSLFRAFLGNIVKPLQTLGLFSTPKRSSSYAPSSSVAVGPDYDAATDQSGVTHHSPTQVLRNFNDIQFLRIELPSGELGVDEGVILKWRADFGSTLDHCVILGASSVVYLKNSGCLDSIGEGNNNNNSSDDSGSIPDSFYTNGGLKLRVVWTISSLIAASARHYLLQPIIADHKTLDNLVLTDADGQGVLCMNRDQLEELRVKPLSASSASKRTLVPALNMRLWYAPRLELPDGVVLNGATLVAIRPSEQSLVKKEAADGSWISSAFEEPFGTAAKMLLKRRTYCLEMNSF